MNLTAINRPIVEHNNRVEGLRLDRLSERVLTAIKSGKQALSSPLVCGAREITSVEPEWNVVRHLGSRSFCE